MITSISHSASQPGPFSGSGAEPRYSNQFSCIPKECQYRPPRKTPRPYLPSVQTAVVVGPSGEEIYTDEFGRVKVQFHWDREGKKDENTSCWMRVSQVHAGVGFGGIDIPRVGEEVIVSFIEGDLDAPVVTGRLYHKESMPPFGLPASKTISGLKSKTYKGSGYNEMVMDDTPGKELIRIHAQYDMSTTVEHDDTQTVHNDRTITVNGKHTETIKKDTKITISEGPYEHKVAANTAKYHVEGALTETYNATQVTTVKNNITIESTAGEILIKAANKITLLTGSSKLEMTADGKISLVGIDIAVKGSASVSTKGGIVHSFADSQHETKGAVVLSEGSATNTIKGGMVMLN